MSGSENIVFQILDRYKRKQSGDSLILLPILNETAAAVGFLRPVTADFKATIPRCIELLDRWRMENPTLSPSRFRITHERTEKWITDAIIQDRRRILFLIQALDGNYIGHVGFRDVRPEKHSAEVDMVARGEKGVSPGIMGFALAALIRWGIQKLHLRHIDLVVIPENAHGIAFYRRCGFREDGIVPLQKIESGQEISWIRCQQPCPDPEFYFLHMVFSNGEHL